MNLRFHHLNSILQLRADYDKWQTTIEKNVQVPFSDLFKHPETARAFADVYASYLAETAYRGAMGIIDSRFAFNEIQQWFDYVGKQGEGKDEYQRLMNDFYYDFLTMDPDEKIRISYETDAICLACSGKERDDHLGKHCVREYRSYNDYIWDYTLEQFLIVFKNDSETLKQMERFYTQEGPTYLIPAGVLRDDKITEFLREHSDYIQSYVEGSLVLLKKIGILEESDEPFERVTEAYIRGEKGN